MDVASIHELDEDNPKVLLLDVTRCLDAENTQGALVAANEALASSKKAGDSRGLTDSLMLLIDCHLQAAEATREKPVEALNLASEELTNFRASGDKRGEAAMMLSLTKCYLSPAKPSVDEAMELGTQTIYACRNAKDKQLEAMTLLVMVDVFVALKTGIRKKNLKDAVRCGDQALAVFTEVSEKLGEAKAHRAIAGVHKICGKWKEFVKEATMAVTLFQSLGEKKMEACQLLALAEWNLDQGNVDQGLSMACESLEAFQAMGPNVRRRDTVKVWEALALGVVVRAYIFNHSAQLAFQAAADGLDRFQRAGNKKGMALANEAHAFIYMCVEDFELAQDHARQALRVARDLSDKALEATVLLTMSDIADSAGMDRRALDGLEDALQVYREIDDKAGQGSVWHKTLQVLVKRQDYDAAMESAAEAIKFFSKNEDRAQQCAMIMLVCGIYMRRRDFNAALLRANEAVSLYHEDGNKAGQVEALQAMGEALLNQAEFARAVQIVIKAEKICKDIGDAASQCKSLTQLAIINLRAFEHAVSLIESSGQFRQRPDEKFFHAAVEAARQARPLARKVQSPVREAMTFLVEAQARLVARHLDQAIELAEQASLTFKEFSDFASQGGCLLVLAQANYNLGNSDVAASQATEASQIFSALGNEDGVSAARDIIAVAMPQQQQAMVQPPAAGVEWMNGAMPSDMATFDANKPQEVAPKAPTTLALSLDDVRRKVRQIAENLVSIDDISNDRSLMEMGADSLAITQMRADLREAFGGTEMPATLLFEFPTISELSMQIFPMLQGD